MKTGSPTWRGCVALMKQLWQDKAVQIVKVKVKVKVTKSDTSIIVQVT